MKHFKQTEQMEKTIYKLKLHETMDIITGVGNYGELRIGILRVAGGWIYSTRNVNAWVQTYVPFNDEYKIKQDR